MHNAHVVLFLDLLTEELAREGRLSEALEAAYRLEAECDLNA